jgi:peptide/nickel transport system permease protein
VSVPPLLSILLLILFAARTGLLPVGGMTAGLEGATGREVIWDRLRHLVAPAVALALPLGAAMARVQQGALRSALAEPHLLAAAALGLSRRAVIARHALRISLRPLASVYGFIVGALLSGSFAVEIVTAWPGLGRLTYDALLSRDLFLVTGCAAAGAIFLSLGTLISDLAIAVIDPRVRSGR